MEYGLALAAIHLPCLLSEQRVDVGVVAIDELPALHHEHFQPRRRVAERTRSGLDEVLELLLAIALEEARAFDGTDLNSDADFSEIVDHGLRNVGVGGIAIVEACIQTAGIPRLPQEPSRLSRVEDRFRRLPEIFIHVGNDGIAGDLGKAHGHRLIDALAIDGEAGGAAYTGIVPRRFWIPLIGEIHAERSLDRYGLQGQSRRLLHRLSGFAADGI